jgi:membrane fusion protein (multidrug efflux system)
MLAKAQADLGRIRPLAEMKAVSQQDLDGAIAQRDAAVGSVQAAEAQLELANIELGYTRIHSPINGLIGISQVEVGEFVSSGLGSGVLNFVSRSDPIRVRFSINERDYLRFAREEARRRREGIPDDVANDEADRIKLILADGSVHDHAGTIVAGDAAINSETGTLTLEADFPDPENIVIAGQFALARVIIDHRKGAVLVPQRAISELQGIFRVFVVDAEGMVSLRTIELGPEYGRYRIVVSGLEPSERVAVEGLLRLQDGMQVAPQVVSLEDRSGGAGG